MLPILPLLVLGAFLFSTGITLVIVKKNSIMILLGIELMLNASNINLISFSQMYQQRDGQLFALFVMVVAVCEVAVGLAIIIKVYQHFRSVVPDDAKSLHENQ